jgi:integrase
MSARCSLAGRVDDYIRERRQLGFQMKSKDVMLHRFARHVHEVGHKGHLTIEVMAQWAQQARSGCGNRATYARQLAALRPFTRWLQQFEPATEIPGEPIFGSVPGRSAPHIYRETEIAELLTAARQIGPEGTLRGFVMETLFGLIACTGLRISEAVTLRFGDVDLRAGVLTIRDSKFGKSRLVPLHESSLEALVRYRAARAVRASETPESPFFIATRWRGEARPVSSRQADRVFSALRHQLGWIGRGQHGEPRIHDLRHTFAVRRLLNWHAQGIDVHQRMLALSTYLGHAKVSNTYWYLTGVPELMELAGQSFEKFADMWGGNDV